MDIDSQWLNRTFSYWKPDLMPTPREAMADLKANDTQNYNKIIDKYGAKGTDRHDVEWALETLIIESGDLNLQQRYGWLGRGWIVSNDGSIATHSE